MALQHIYLIEMAAYLYAFTELDTFQPLPSRTKVTRYKSFAISFKTGPEIITGNIKITDV